MCMLIYPLPVYSNALVYNGTTTSAPYFTIEQIVSGEAGGAWFYNSVLYCQAPGSFCPAAAAVNKSTLLNFARDVLARRGIS